MQQVNLEKYKKCVFCNTTTVVDIMKVSSDTIIIPSGLKYVGNSHSVGEVKDDGVVLLFYATLPVKVNTYNMHFDKEFAKKIKTRRQYSESQIGSSW